MPKGNRSSSGSGVYVTSTANNATQVPNQQTNAPQNPQAVPPAQPAQPQQNPNAPAGSYEGKVLFTGSDGTEYHEMTNMTNYYRQQQSNAESIFDLDSAMQSYNDSLQDIYDPDPKNRSYSKSQNLNHSLVNGLPLNANQKFMYNVLQSEMHPLGVNAVLTRYDHAGFVNKLVQGMGISDVQNLTNAQLKKALTDVNYTENKFVSTTYNNFINNPSNPFDSREIKIIYHAKAGTKALAMKNGNGGNQGEVLLGAGQSYTIKNAYFNGGTARSKKTQTFNKRQITLEVEVG